MTSLWILLSLAVVGAIVRASRKPELPPEASPPDEDDLIDDYVLYEMLEDDGEDA